MNSVRQLLKEKGNEVWTISPNKTVYQALELMAEKDVGALIVADGQNVLGIFSERDYARKVILKGISSVNTTISQLMVKEVIYVTPDESIDDCMALMTKNRIRHLPVIEDNSLIGLVSIGDVVNHIISIQEFKINELKKYITGSY